MASRAAEPVVRRPPVAATQPAPPPQATAPVEDPAATRAAFDKLKEAVATAREAKDHADHENARPIRPGSRSRGSRCSWLSPRPSRRRRWPCGYGWLLAALAAGVTATVGLGMVVTGAAIEPAVGSLAQIRAILAVPVLGVVAETGSTKAARAGRPNLLRLLWIVTGADRDGQLRWRPCCCSGR